MTPQTLEKAIELKTWIEELNIYAKQFEGGKCLVGCIQNMDQHGNKGVHINLSPSLKALGFTSPISGFFKDAMIKAHDYIIGLRDQYQQELDKL